MAYLIGGKMNHPEPTLLESKASAKKRFVETGKVQQDIVDRLSEADPTKATTNKYLELLCALWLWRMQYEHGYKPFDPNFDMAKGAKLASAYGPHEANNLSGNYEPILKHFEMGVQRKFITGEDANLPNFVNILIDPKKTSSEKGNVENKFQTLAKVAHDKFIEASLTKKGKLEGAEKILDDKRWLIVKPLTKLGSQIYGKGSKWCVTSTNANSRYWEDHTNRGYEFYFITDKTKQVYDHITGMGDRMYKVAIAVPSKTVNIGDYVTGGEIDKRVKAASTGGDVDLAQTREMPKIIVKVLNSKRVSDPVELPTVQFDLDTVRNYRNEENSSDELMTVYNSIRAIHESFNRSRGGGGSVGSSLDRNYGYGATGLSGWDAPDRQLVFDVAFPYMRLVADALYKKEHGTWPTASKEDTGEAKKKKGPEEKVFVLDFLRMCFPGLGEEYAPPQLGGDGKFVITEDFLSECTRTSPAGYKDAFVVPPLNFTDGKFPPVIASVSGFSVRVFSSVLINTLSSLPTFENVNELTLADMGAEQTAEDLFAQIKSVKGNVIRLSGLGITTLKGFPTLTEGTDRPTQVNISGCYNLKSLEGLPETLNSSLSLYELEALDTLAGMPAVITGLLSIQACSSLASLAGCSASVGGLLIHRLNNLTSLEGMPSSVTSTMEGSAGWNDRLASLTSKGTALSLNVETSKIKDLILPMEVAGHIDCPLKTLSSIVPNATENAPYTVFTYASNDESLVVPVSVLYVDEHAVALSTEAAQQKIKLAMSAYDSNPVTQFDAASAVRFIQHFRSSASDPVGIVFVPKTRSANSFDFLVKAAAENPEVRAAIKAAEEQYKLYFLGYPVVPAENVSGYENVIGKLVALKVR